MCQEEQKGISEVTWQIKNDEKKFSVASDVQKTNLIDFSLKSCNGI